MKEIIKRLYDHQLDLSLIGAQLEEKALRLDCPLLIEAELRSHSRNFLLTASNIKYELFLLEQNPLISRKNSNPDSENLENIQNSLASIERMLYQTLKQFVDLLVAVEEKRRAEAVKALVKEVWEQVATNYQQFKKTMGTLEKQMV